MVSMIENTDNDERDAQDRLDGPNATNANADHAKEECSESDSPFSTPIVNETLAEEDQFVETFEAAHVSPIMALTLIATGVLLFLVIVVYFFVDSMGFSGYPAVAILWGLQLTWVVGTIGFLKRARTGTSLPLLLWLYVLLTMHGATLIIATLFALVLATCLVVMA